MWSVVSGAGVALFFDFPAAVLINGSSAKLKSAPKIGRNLTRSFDRHHRESTSKMSGLTLRDPNAAETTAAIKEFKLRIVSSVD
jgi:hypothetical protein